MSTAAIDEVAGTGDRWAECMNPEDVAAFKCGYVFAFETLNGSQDLAYLLSNFAGMIETQALPTDDGWLSEAKRFVSKVYDQLDMDDWLHDSNGPIDRDSITPTRFPNDLPDLNAAACQFLTLERKLQKERAKQVKRAIKAKKRLGQF